MSFPINATVYDRITGKTYRVKKSDGIFTHIIDSYDNTEYKIYTSDLRVDPQPREPTASGLETSYWEYLVEQDQYESAIFPGDSVNLNALVAMRIAFPKAGLSYRKGKFRSSLITIQTHKELEAFYLGFKAAWQQL